MIDALYDVDKKCIAYVEWSVVDNQGKLDDKGEYIFVEELWIWEEIRGSRGKCIIKSFIKDIGTRFPQLKFAYWKRHKYKGRVKVFTRLSIYGKD